MAKKLIGLAFVLACGGTAQDEVIEHEETIGEIQALLSAHPKPAKYARIIEHLEYGRETIDFLDTPEIDESGHTIANITTIRVVPPNDMSIVTKLETLAGMPLSPAEIWLAVTGREDLSDELAQHHLGWTARRARKIDFQRLNLRDAANIPMPKLTQAQFDAEMYVAVPSHTHTYTRTTYEGNSDGKVRHSCSEAKDIIPAAPHFMLGDGLQKSDCVTPFWDYFRGGWLRHGFGVDAFGTRSMAVSWCGGYRNQPDWFCYAAVVAGPGWRVFVDSVTNANEKGGSFTATCSNVPGFCNAFVGSSWLKNQQGF